MSFIAVEGPIGVGKTTLASRLAESLDARLILDPDSENPYLDAFYRDRSQYAFHTQMQFLASRVDLLVREGRGATGQDQVADFLLAKDQLFAELALDEQEWWIYQALFQRLSLPALKPDLVIYLQAPVEILFQRIEQRGRKSERRIDSGYLQRVVELYERFFHNHDDTALLIVNAAGINLDNDRQDYANLLDRVASTRSGRHYFNPA